MERLLSSYLIDNIILINLKSQRRVIFANLAFYNNQIAKQAKQAVVSSFVMFSQNIDPDEFGWYAISVKSKKQHNMYVTLTKLGLKFHKLLTPKNKTQVLLASNAI